MGRAIGSGDQRRRALGTRERVERGARPSGDQSESESSARGDGAGGGGGQTRKNVTNVRNLRSTPSNARSYITSVPIHRMRLAE